MPSRLKKMQIEPDARICINRSSKPVSVGMEEGKPFVWFVEDYEMNGEDEINLNKSTFCFKFYEEGEDVDGSYLGRITILGCIFHVFFREH